MNQESRELVERWVSEQSPRIPLLPSKIASDLQGRVDPTDIVELLISLSDQGQIRQVFAVRVPSGSVLRRVYRTLDEIEPEVQDQFNRLVPSDDLEVLPAFEKVDG